MEFNHLYKTAAALVIAAGTVLSGCSKPQSTDKRVITLSVQSDSEDLALAGEQLVQPHSFMLANRIFDLALEKDPHNQRAQFYKAFIKPLMTMQGLARRAVPFVKLDGDLGRYNKGIANFPESSLRDFLLTGDGEQLPDINNYHDAQTYLVQFRDALDGFRKYLKAHPDLNLTLNLNPFLWRDQINQKMSENCKVVGPQNGPSSDDNMTIECDYRHITQTKINSADVTLLQQSVAGMVLYLDFLTSYDAQGSDSIINMARQRQAEGKPPMSSAEMQALLEQQPRFGKLRADQGMTKISELGADLVPAWAWVIKYQDQICSTTNAPARPGYLFETGMCIAKEDMAQQKQNLSYLAAGLNGPIVDMPLQDSKGVTRTTTIDPFVLSRHPIMDLRSIAPTSYDACDNATSLRDKTFGGLFPRGDAETFLTGGECQR